MKYDKRSFISYILTMFLGINVCNLQAQEIVTSTGGSATGSGGTASYTVGQIAYSTITSNTGTITQGVQQPYEILVITGLKVATGITLEFAVYPNPTSDFLILKIESHTLESLNYILYDIYGRILQNGEIVDRETIIQTVNLLPASYYLKVSDDQKEMKTFKIIKN